MDDVLQRMMETDRQGELIVKKAEEEAAAIREAGAQQLSRLNADFASETARLCAAEIENAVRQAEERREKELSECRRALVQRKEQFASAIESRRQELFSRLTGVKGV